MICVSIFYIPLIFDEVNIPVIMVFTKYDRLVLMHYLRDCGHIPSQVDRKVEAINRAESSFRDFTTKEVTVPFAPVTTRKEEYRGLLIISATSLVSFKNGCSCRSDARAIDQGDTG